MALYDRTGVRIEINAAMTRETGKRDHDLLGRPMGHSASGRTFADSRGVAEALRQVVATGEPVTTELHGMGSGDAARRVWLMALVTGSLTTSSAVKAASCWCQAARRSQASSRVRLPTDPPAAHP
ncbi:PAS domain-containing protein [Streptomyces sp. NPDC002676]